MSPTVPTSIERRIVAVVPDADTRFAVQLVLARPYDLTVFESPEAAQAAIAADAPPDLVILCAERHGLFDAARVLDRLRGRGTATRAIALLPAGTALAAAAGVSRGAGFDACAVRPIDDEAAFLELTARVLRGDVSGMPPAPGQNRPQVRPLARPVGSAATGGGHAAAASRGTAPLRFRQPQPAVSMLRPARPFLPPTTARARSA